MDEQHRTAVEHEAPGPQPPELALTTAEDAEGNRMVLRYSERQLLDAYRAGAAAEVEPDARVVEVLERLGRMRRASLEDEAMRVAKLDELGRPSVDLGTLAADVHRRQLAGVRRIGRALRPLAPLPAVFGEVHPPTEEELAERRDPAALRDRVLDHLADAVDDAISPAEDDPHAEVRASTRVRQYAGAAASLGELVPPPAEAVPAPALEAVLAEAWNAVQEVDVEEGVRVGTAFADRLVEQLRARLS